VVLVGVLRPGIPSVVRPSGVPVLVRSVPCPLFYTHGLIALAIRGRRLLLVHGMVGHSNLSRSEYLPLRGSIWDRILASSEVACNPFNDSLEPVVERSTSSSHFELQVEQPAPTWSVERVGNWIHERLSSLEDDAIHSISTRLLSCNSCIVPSISSSRFGLFPAFHQDIFGIEGVAGLSQWIIDSGATSSCTSDLSLFTQLSSNVPFRRIRVANGKYASVRGIGTVRLQIMDSCNGISTSLVLKDVLYIPEVPVNLISTRSIWNHSKIKTTLTDVCTLEFKNKTRVVLDTGSKEGHYYCIARSAVQRDTRAYESMSAANYSCSVCVNEPSVNSVSPDTVHARLGHPSAVRAQRALESSLGLPNTPNYKQRLQPHCEGCRLGGARKHPFHPVPEQFRPRVFGDRIQSDLCGEFPVSASHHYKYILSFVDAATGYSEVYFLQSKHASEVQSYFEQFVRKWSHKLPNGVVR
jgi:hypothetical protein